MQEMLSLDAGQIGKGFCILEEGTLEVIRDEKVLSEIETPKVLSLVNSVKSLG